MSADPTAISPQAESKCRILPGATLGVVGGGQLGRMFTIEAKKLGYTVGVLDPEEQAPAAQVADFSLVADYTDAAAIQALAEKCHVLTFEFENIDAPALRAAVANRCPVHPSPEVLHTTQNRAREKAFLAALGIPLPRYAVVDSPAALAAALAELGTPAVLKTAQFGYDGKGQIRLEAGCQVEALGTDFAAPLGVLESWVPFVAELSVVCARSALGEVRCFPVAENQHRHHILDVSILPARFPETVTREAQALAEKITTALDVVGLLTVEFFLLADGRLLVNELAPRPHNSGHFSFDNARTSQFEQHVRAICGLPLGDPALLSPVVMVNLLGELWPPGGEPPWAELLRQPALKLHLYGKATPRPGRKMGHFCCPAPTLAAALQQAESARQLLGLPAISHPDCVA